jgi:tetratricopeptide (TPR) repeat protein
MSRRTQVQTIEVTANRLIAVLLAVTTALFLIACDRQQTQNPHKTGTAKTYDREGIHHLANAGRLKEAILRAQESLAIAEQMPEGENKEAHRALILYDLGTFHFLAGEYATSRSNLEQALNILRTHDWDNRIGAWQVMLSLAKVYSFVGELEKAESLYKETLKAVDGRAEIPDANRALCLSDYAEFCIVKGDMDHAESLLQRVLQTFEKDPSTHMLGLIAARGRLAAVYRFKARYEESLDLCTKTLKLLESNDKDDQNKLTDILSVRGTVFYEIGKYSEAEGDFQRCLQIQERQGGTQHPEVVTTLSGLATVASATGDYSKAERYYERALEAGRLAYGKNHPVIAMLLGNMATLYSKMGNDQKAIVAAQESFEMSGTVFGEDHWATAAQANTLAVMLRDAGQLEKAKSVLLKAWDVTRRTSGQNSPQVALILGNLALLYEEMGETDEAEKLYKLGLGIRASHFQSKDPGAVDGLNNLAVFYMRRGDLENAENMLDWAMRVAQRTLGEEHPKVAYVLTNLVSFERLRGKLDAAAEAADRARRIVQKHLPKVLDSLSLQEQIKFQKANDYPSWEAGLSLALSHPEQETIARYSAGWVLNGKSMKAEVLARRAKLRGEADDSVIAESLRQLHGVEQALAGLVLDGPQSGESRNYSARLAALEEQQRKLVQQLGTQIGTPLDTGWIPLESVQESLAKGEVLIEVVRFDPVPLRPAFIRPNPSPRFVAWLITDDTSKPPRVVDLGEANKIESAIQEIRATLQNAVADIHNDGEPKAEARLRDKLKRLSDLVIAPLSKELADKPTWLVSPDGSLSIVPWEMLLINGKYVVENHTVSYVISGRQLLRRPTHKKPGMSVVVADPDFDAVVTGPKDLVGAEDSASRQAYRAESINLETLRSVKWSRLPGTREEARRVISKLSEFAGGQKVVALLGKDAQKAEFKRKAKSPRVLVVSTHGFFVPVAPRTEFKPNDGSPHGGRGIGGLSTDQQEMDARVYSSSHLMLANNPLLQCGLALAGANRGDSSNDLHGSDGILNGLEAASLDLTGTELVILSACDTGLGEIHVGEAVSSLRLAFLTAGADEVVATLWKVPDTETAELVSSLVERFAGGQPVEQSLRHAQLDMISQRREKHGASHPLFWASFTCTGRGRYPNRFEYRELHNQAWLFVEHWSDGSPKIRCEMKVNDRGVLLEHGTCVRWHRNGTKREEGTFVNGRCDGKWARWHENGRKASEQIYENGVLSGPFSDWNAAGEKTEEGQFVNGEYSGKIVIWEEGTGRRIDCDYKCGKMHGVSTVYNKQGVKVIESHYKNDELDGPQIFWNEKGEKSVLMYSDGRLLAEPASK